MFFPLLRIYYERQTKQKHVLNKRRITIVTYKTTLVFTSHNTNTAQGPNKYTHKSYNVTPLVYDHVRVYYYYADEVHAPGNDNLRGFTAFLPPGNGAFTEKADNDTLFAGEFELLSLLQQTVFELFGFLGVKECLTSQGRPEIQRSFQLQPQLVLPSS